MSIGAVFACLNTMYGAVAARTREIGVARSIGFGAPAVALGVLVESVLLSLSGGISGRRADPTRTQRHSDQYQFSGRRAVRLQF